MKVRTEMGHFWLTFENGYTLSVFNGYGSYTENHMNLKKFKEITDTQNIYDGWESEKVEIAILNSIGDLITQNIIESDGSVKTIDVNELVEVINIVSKLDK